MGSSLLAHCARHHSASHRRGMTLVEVMVVVAIVGVLSTLAVYGVTKYVRSTQATEAYAVINAIKGAQEVYRQDTFRYLDVSADYTKSFPADEPAAGAKMAWAGDGPTADKFDELGVDIDAPTYFVFACVAANANVPIDPSPTQGGNFGLNATALISEPRFLVVAKADLDGDGELSYAASHNLMNEIYTEKEGE